MLFTPTAGCRPPRQTAIQSFFSRGGGLFLMQTTRRFFGGVGGFSHSLLCVRFTRGEAGEATATKYYIGPKGFYLGFDPDHISQHTVLVTLRFPVPLTLQSLALHYSQHKTALLHQIRGFNNQGELILYIKKTNIDIDCGQICVLLLPLHR